MPEIMVLDTHIWVWWLTNKNNYLSTQQIDLIEQTKTVGISVISCFEVAQLVKRERLHLPMAIDAWINEALLPAGIELLPITPEIACAAVALTDIHKDPFDRIIIATSLKYSAALMSVDNNFKHYPELQGWLLHA